MAMKICPNCLISIYYQKNICHQCGYEIDKPPQSSQDILPRLRSSKSIFLHKFKFRRASKLKLID
jgi:predicted amidophosphoribosyltransferase